MTRKGGTAKQRSATPKLEGSSSLEHRPMISNPAEFENKRRNMETSANAGRRRSKCDNKLINHGLNLPTVVTDENCIISVQVVAFSLLLRFVAWRTAGNWLQERPEYATPLTAIDRLRQPLIIHAASAVWSISSSDGKLLLIFMVVDVLSGLLFAVSAIIFTAEQRKEKNLEHDTKGTAVTVLKWFLLNPLSVTTCASLSLSTLFVFLAALFTFAFFARKRVLSVVVLSVWTVLSMYPVILLPPLLNQMRSRASASAMTVLFVFSTIALFALNAHLAGWSSNFAEATYLFTIRVEDLSPNVGIFWYFFTEIFKHFRTFFLVLFQLNLLVFVVPLLVTLRHVPHLNLVISYVLLAVFVPYPSLADSTVFIALIPLIENKYKKHMSIPLVAGCTLAVCVALMPVMWHMWIGSGSGNANFFFGVTLFYNTAIIQMGMDLLYGYLRMDIEEKCPGDVPDDKVLFVYN